MSPSPEHEQVHSMPTERPRPPGTVVCPAASGERTRQQHGLVITPELTPVRLNAIQTNERNLMDILVWWLNLVGRIANRSQGDDECRLPDDSLISPFFCDRRK
jgi:hypothetical protein